jgi:hypothetical protein
MIPLMTDENPHIPADPDDRKTDPMVVIVFSATLLVLLYLVLRFFLL